MLVVWWEAPVVWSPDSTKLVYDAYDDLYVDDVATGRTTPLLKRTVYQDFPPSYGLFRQAAFSADGRTVIFPRPRTSSMTGKSDVWAVPVTGGEPTLLCGTPGSPDTWPTGRLSSCEVMRS